MTTRLIQVSVIVHKDGKPVADLAAGDFRLYEDGKEQPIELFSVESERSSGRPAEPLSPSDFSNREGRPSGGVSVIVLDRLNTSWDEQIRAREQIVKFLGQIQPEDRVGLYVLESSSVRVLHDFTKNTRSLVRALARYQAMASNELVASEDQAPETGEADIDAWLQGEMQKINSAFLVRRMEATAGALEAIANHLAGVRGRKNLVWLSAAFPFIVNDGKTALDTRTISADLVRANRALNDADVAVYPVDVRGLMGAFTGAVAARSSVKDSSRDLRAALTTLETTNPGIETMKTIADDTGGRAFYNTNDISGGIRRAVDDARVTYILGYSPSHGKWDGRFHEIKVKVSRGGVEVRHRRGYLALPLPQPNSTKTAEALRDAVKSPMEATGIGLTAHVERAGAQATDPVNVAIRVDPAGVSLEKAGEKWEGALDVVIAQGLPDGTSFKSLDTTVNLSLTSEMRDRMMKQGLVVNRKVPLRDDAHRLHIVVRDVRNGAIGSVIIPADKLRAAAWP